jgi:beta-lactamase class A
MMGRLLVLGLLVVAGIAAWGQSAVEVLEEQTVARIREFAAKGDGVIAVAAIDLSTGRRFGVNFETELAQASVIKVPILWRVMSAVQAGELSLAARYTLQPNEAVGGSGRLQQQLRKGPVTLTLADLLRKMIENSDNTATNKVIELAGMERVNQAMAELGLRQTRLQRIMMDTAAAGEGRENVSTAAEMAGLMQRIWQREQENDAAAKQMVDWLELVPGEVKKVAGGARVAAKTGELTGVRNEAAIVYLPRRPYVLVVLSAFQAGATNPAGEVARIVHAHVLRLASANAYGNGVWAP